MNKRFDSAKGVLDIDIQWTWGLGCISRKRGGGVAGECSGSDYPKCSDAFVRL